MDTDNLQSVCNSLTEVIRKILTEKNSGSDNVNSWRSWLKVAVMKFLIILEDESVSQQIKDTIQVVLQSVKKINLVLETADLSYLKELMSLLVKEIKMLLSLEASQVNLPTSVTRQPTTHVSNQQPRATQSVSSSNTAPSSNRQTSVRPQKEISQPVSTNNNINTSSLTSQEKQSLREIEDELKVLIRNLFKTHSDRDQSQAQTITVDMAKKINEIRKIPAIHNDRVSLKK